MERIEDRSKALSYIGIEVADALKVIPKPVDTIVEENVVEEVKPVENAEVVKTEENQVKSQVLAVEENKEEEKRQIQEYQESVSFDKKPSLWQRFKNSKVVRAFTYVFKIRIRIELPNALPEGKGE